jgi:hypothetical protein
MDREGCLGIVTSSVGTGVIVGVLIVINGTRGSGRESDLVPLSAASTPYFPNTNGEIGSFGAYFCTKVYSFVVFTDSAISG